MLKLFLLSCLMLSTTLLFSQENEKGYYNLSKQKNDQAQNITFQFEGPDSKPVKSHVIILINRDTIVPVFSQTGTYNHKLSPGNYKFLFDTPGWYKIETDTVHLQAKMRYKIFVHFEALEIPLKGLPQK